MPLDVFRDRHHDLYAALQQFQDVITKNDVDINVLQTTFQTVQHHFQQVMALDLSDLPPQHISVVQSMHTEMNKQMRLLGVDITFLRAARRSATSQQRQQQIGDRITQLLQFCNQILEAI